MNSKKRVVENSKRPPFWMGSSDCRKPIPPTACREMESPVELIEALATLRGTVLGA
jgi:hypothetical protein